MSCTDEMKLIIAVGHQPAVTWDDLDNMIKWLREQVDHDASHWREIAKIVGLDIDRDGDTDEDYHKQVVAAVRLQYEDVSADRKRARIALNDAHAQLTKAHAELEVARAERNDAVSCIAGWERKEAEYKTTLSNYAGIQKLLSTTQDRLDEFQGVCGDQAIQIMELRSEVASAKVNRDPEGVIRDMHVQNELTLTRIAGLLGISAESGWEDVISTIQEREGTISLREDNQATADAEIDRLNVSLKNLTYRLKMTETSRNEECVRNASLVKEIALTITEREEAREALATAERCIALDAANLKRVADVIGTDATWEAVIKELATKAFAAAVFNASVVK